MADSSKNKFGLIGNPVSGSKSPDLFKAAYGGKYPYDLIEEPDFETAWQRFLGTDSPAQTTDGGQAGYTAINVTAPFKEKAFAKVLEAARKGHGSIDGPCFKIGATNLVVRKDDDSFEPVLEAHNSDFTGVILSVAEVLFPGITDEFYREFGSRAPIKIHQFVRQQIDNVYPRGPQALIVGCGGAGRAAAVAAAELGFATALMNRTLEKAQSLAQARPEYGFLPVPLSDFRGAVRECDLVIYTLPGLCRRGPRHLPAPRQDHPRSQLQDTRLCSGNGWMPVCQRGAVAEGPGHHGLRLDDRTSTGHCRRFRC